MVHEPDDSRGKHTARSTPPWPPHCAHMSTCARGRGQLLLQVIMHWGQYSEICLIERLIDGLLASCK